MIGRLITKLICAEREAVRRLGLIPDLARLMRDPRRSASYHAAADHKPRWRVWREQLVWLLRYGEVNRYYWAYGFDVAGFNRWHDYLPYIEFMRLRNAANQGTWVNGTPVDIRSLLRDKLLFNVLLKGLGVPAPPLLAYGTRDRLTWLDGGVTEPAENLVARQGLDGFLKDAVGECAAGVWHVRVESGRLLVDGREVIAGDWLRGLGQARVVLEGTVQQHPEVACLHPASVNTLRLVTVLTPDGARPFSCILRIGCGGRRVDNTARGGLFVMVDLERGVLKGDGFFWPEHGTRTDRHPDTELVFEGRQLPFLRDAVSLACRLHEQVLYGLHSIGWDLALSPDGPLVLEANDNWEIPHAQLTGGGQRQRFTALCGAWAARRGGQRRVVAA